MTFNKKVNIQLTNREMTTIDEKLGKGKYFRLPYLSKEVTLVIQVTDNGEWEVIGFGK